MSVARRIKARRNVALGTESPPGARPLMTRSDLTIADVAARLGVRESTVRAYMSRGQMPAPSGRLGRTPYWRPNDIEPWLGQRSSRTATTTREGNR